MLNFKKGIKVISACCLIGMTVLAGSAEAGADSEPVPNSASPPIVVQQTFSGQEQGAEAALNGEPKVIFSGKGNLGEDAVLNLQTEAEDTGQENTEERQPAVIDFEFVEKLEQIKMRSRQKYNEIIEGMTDEEYSQYFEIYQGYAEEAEKRKYMVQEAAVEGRGSNYLMRVYDIDPDVMTDEEFIQTMHQYELKNDEIFFDIIDNLTDEQYERFFEIYKFYTENDLFMKIDTFTPMIYKGGMIYSGDSVDVNIVDGKPQFPEVMIFYIRYTDGTEKYLYGDSSEITYQVVNQDVVTANYKDVNGFTAEYVFANPGALWTQSVIEQKPGMAPVITQQSGYYGETEPEQSEAVFGIADNILSVEQYVPE